MLELEARRFEDAEHLDRRFASLSETRRLEQRVHAKAPQAREHGNEPRPWNHAIESGQLGERLMKLGARLELLRIERAPAGKSGGGKQGGKVPHPLVRRLLP